MPPRLLVFALCLAPLAAVAQTRAPHTRSGDDDRRMHTQQPEPKSPDWRKFEKKQRGCRAIPIPDECLN